MKRTDRRRAGAGPGRLRIEPWGRLRMVYYGRLTMWLSLDRRDSWLQKGYAINMALDLTQTTR